MTFLIVGVEGIDISILLMWMLEDVHHDIFIVGVEGIDISIFLMWMLEDVHHDIFYRGC